jgi:hypothetical protein
MSEFADIIASVHATVASLHGVRVRYTYTNAEGDLATLLIDGAVPTAPSEAVDVADGLMMVDAKSRDFLIPVESLTRGITIIEPQKGDTIEECAGDADIVQATYTVMQPNTGTPPWRWHDRTRTIRRIHTKETAAVNP